MLNYNTFYSTSYKLEFPLISATENDNFEMVNAFLQSCSIPGFSMADVDVSYTNHVIRTPGNTVIFEPLVVNIILDENLYSYLSIRDWLVAMKDVDNWKDFLRDVKLFVLTNQKQPNFIFTFADAFPINLGPVRLDSSMMDTDISIVSCSFAYNYMRWERQ